MSKRKKHNIDLLRDSALYTQTEASRFLGIPRNTLRYWAYGYKRDSRKKIPPIIKAPSGSNQLSFFNLVELHVIDSIREEHKVELPKIRKALKFLENNLKSSRPLLDEDFETDGVDLFVENYGNLINVSSQGQQAMRTILQNSLKRIKRDAKNIPVKLYPYTHSKPEDSPEVISMSPSIFSGRPVIDGTRISTHVIAERYRAGDSISTLKKDFQLSKLQVEEAIRCELKKAA